MRQEMECEVENPSGYLPPASVLQLGQPGDGRYNDEVFLAGWLVTPLVDPLISPLRVQYAMHHTEGVRKGEAAEIGRGRENSAVVLAYIRKTTRRWIHI